MVKGQNERLMAMLDEIMGEAGTNWDALDAIAVGVGPGNFTGVRIAVAAARGFALALGVPAIGVTGLEALACAADTKGETTAVIDARGGRVYVQRFLGGAPLDEPQMVPQEQADAPPDRPFPIDALAHIAATRLAGGTIAPPAPLYLRAPDAALPSEPAPIIVP